MGVWYVVPILNTPSAATWEQLPLRLALTAPFVWLGWFSARNYGHISRLSEDYEYKEASAKAFEGYKREVGDAHPEMLQKLLEQAIQNLGENPIRIFEGKNNHGSPVQDLIEKVLSDEKLVAKLKEVFAAVKP